MQRILTSLMLAAAVLAMPAWGQVAPTPQQVAPAAEPDIYTAEIVARYPHDTGAFTQGLLWHDGHLYESTGQKGQSQIRQVDLTTGTVQDASDIPATQFGEGMALWGDTLISLTWQDRVIHRWNRADLAHQGSAEFPFEGWGLTSDGTSLIASDGSPTLRFLDPETYAVQREVQVSLRGKPLPRLNELEMVDGLIYANVWFSPYVVAIDPADGVVQRILDLRPIVAENKSADTDAVLNGIAYDPEGQRLFVTGKRWPTLYEVTFVKRD